MPFRNQRPQCAKLTTPLGVSRAARFGVWRSLVARFVRVEEVVGSNPATPTKIVRGRPPSLEGATRVFPRGCTSRTS